jgi:hypothetical protein
MDHQKCVRVVWIDSGYALGLDGWSPINDLVKDWKPTHMDVLTVGMLMYEDDDVIGICLSWSDSTQAAYGMQIIHRKSIKSFEVLDAKTTE